MLRSFFNAVTGMDASRFWIDVTSDNLANVNTVGFKAQRPIFQDAISQVNIGLNVVTGTLKSTTYGAGVLVDSTQKIWNIGNFKQTGVNTDLAIQGRGLFILKDPITGANLYTRDGQFRLSRDGYMVNSGGFYLQGFRLNEKGEVVGTGLESIHVQQQLPPKATTALSFLNPTNLNANAIVPATPVFDPDNPNSYNYKYTMTIYDTLGNPYQADVYFKKVSTNVWEMFVLADYDGDGQAEDLIANAYADGQDGGKNYVRLVFDNDGNLINLSNDKIISATIGTKRYYYFNLFDSSNPPPEGINTVSGGQLGGQVDRLGLSDPNQMVFIVGEELTVDSLSDISTSTTSVTGPVTDNFTGDGSTTTFTLSAPPVSPRTVTVSSVDFGSGSITLYDDGSGNLVDASNTVYGSIDYSTGQITFNSPPVSGNNFSVSYNYTFRADGSTREFQLAYVPVVPGSISTSVDFGGGPVNLSDDGTGNLVDSSNNIYGKVDYTTGLIEFFTPPASSTTFSVNYSYGSYDGDNSDEDIIANTYVNQFAADFIVTAEQDGYAKGDLIDVYVLSEDGSVVGVYSNGKSIPLYRVALAVFTDPEELTKKGANLYTSINTPTILLAGGAEKVRSGMLEMSNVDIAKEFISLITAQRAYQANARVITTANTILDETVNLVR